MKHREKKEFSGKDLDFALGEAEEYFGVPREKLVYRVIKEKTSFYGKERKIHIQAWIKDEEDLEKLKDFLHFFKEKLSLNGDFQIQEERGDILTVNYTGDDSFIFTENYGELLNDLQYLLNRLFPYIGKRIVTDSSGFRKEREAYLKRLAKKVAERVKKTGEEEMLFPMEPSERRIIHMVVNSMEGVSSKSEGEGYIKRIKIKKIKNG